MILSSKIVDYLFIPLEFILEIRDLSCYQVNVHESVLEGIKGRLIERYKCASIERRTECLERVVERRVEGVSVVLCINQY